MKYPEQYLINFVDLYTQLCWQLPQLHDKSGSHLCGDDVEDERRKADFVWLQPEGEHQRVAPPPSITFNQPQSRFVQLPLNNHSPTKRLVLWFPADSKLLVLMT